MVEWGGIVGIYSSGGKEDKKHENDPMETTITHMENQVCKSHEQIIRI